MADTAAHLVERVLPKVPVRLARVPRRRWPLRSARVGSRSSRPRRSSGERLGVQRAEERHALQPGLPRA
jgi:hypothetical protein